MSEKRAYRLKERAVSKEQTRQKIVEATMHLHEDIGPRATTISAIAEKAGVQRLTVYRHFPDETAVFEACTAHWLSLNPPPDPTDWAGLEAPLPRAAAALSAFYRYYASTRKMWTASFRDVADVPALQGPMRTFAGFLEAITEDLTACFARQGGSDPALVRPTIQHAIAFPTWASLDAMGLDDDAKLSLVTSWITGASQPARA